MCFCSTNIVLAFFFSESGGIQDTPDRQDLHQNRAQQSFESPPDPQQRERERMSYRKYLLDLQDVIAARLAALGLSSNPSTSTSPDQNEV